MEDHRVHVRLAQGVEVLDGAGFDGLGRRQDQLPVGVPGAHQAVRGVLVTVPVGPIHDALGEDRRHAVQLHTKALEDPVTLVGGHGGQLGHRRHRPEPGPAPLQQPAGHHRQAAPDLLLVLGLPVRHGHGGS